MADHHPGKLLAALAQLEQKRDDGNQAAKRSFRRFVIRGEADLHPLDRTRLDDPPIHVHLRDIGRAGVGFITDQKLENDSIWRINFEHRGYPITHETCIVRHVSEVMPGIYLVGTQFCADSGLLVLLGVDPAHLTDGDGPAINTENDFVSPAEVA